MVASHGGHGLFYFMTGVSSLVHNYLDALKANRGNLLLFSLDHDVPAVPWFILIDILQPLLTARYGITTLAGGFLFGSLYENSPPEHA